MIETTDPTVKKAVNPAQNPEKSAWSKPALQRMGSESDIASGVGGASDGTPGTTNGS